MKLVDLTYITVENFKNRKSRVFFTILGVAVAIAAVFSLVAFGYGLQKNLLERITNEESLLSLDIIPADTELIALNEEKIKEIESMENVTEVSPQATFQGEATYDNVTSGISLNIVDSHFLRLEGVNPIAGKFFSETDDKKIVVSTIVADLFNLPYEEAVGKTLAFNLFYPKSKETSEIEVIKLEGEFEIVGVVDAKSSGGEVYLNRSDAPGIVITEYRLAKVKVANNDVIVPVREELIERGFFVSALSDIVDQANKIFRVVQISLGVFGVIALIVAAIGLINTMTIALLERTNEIGVMRAIGASPRDIKRIFLSESTFIGLIGGVSGILLGLAASEILNAFFNILSTTLGNNSVRLFAYPLWFIAFIIILSTIVGFVGGMWPAIRASRMNPLQALKYK